ncbi:MAG: phosphoribosylaminoimidazolesuccinocarboxamide synthase [Candidatus Omnitrophica bacterium]|nr:phosphoribosylaminoimidazolesuccinocarboxamide synthase [Candidatus Omnitrophota bacterium]
MAYNLKIDTVPFFKRGKVRDVYDLGNSLLFVATDRVSCYDVVLPTDITDKGKILTQISAFWFKFLEDIIDNHIITVNDVDLPETLIKYQKELSGRFMIVSKCKVIPFECVVRGYLSGSGWNEYRATGGVCGIKLSEGLRESDKLPEPIFTPATKADAGHDENVDFEYMAGTIGVELAEQLKTLSINIYKKASEYALNRGIIIADTKFEFGINKDGKIILIDEVLTPDSSRFWPKDSYLPGKGQTSYDKQFVRDYLQTLDWDKTPPGPCLPDVIVEKTIAKYKEVVNILTK